MVFNVPIRHRSKEEETAGKKDERKEEEGNDFNMFKKKKQTKKKTTPLLTFSYLGFAITSSSGSFEQIYHRTYHIAQT